MKKIPVTSIAKIKKAIPKIENRVKISIQPYKNYVTIEGNEFDEYTTEKILEAIMFGFETEDALLLRNEHFNLEYVNIKNHTHRKNLGEIRSRIIGTEGKVKRAIETLTGSILVLHENRVGIIGDHEHLPQTIQAIISIIQGSKHGNVFSYLEKQNANLRKIDEEDLGLKNPRKDLKAI